MHFNSLSFLNLIMSIQIQVLELQLPFYMGLLELTAIGNFTLTWSMLPDRSLCYQQDDLLSFADSFPFLVLIVLFLFLVLREGTTS